MSPEKEVEFAFVVLPPEVLAAHEFIRLEELVIWLNHVPAALGVEAVVNQKLGKTAPRFVGDTTEKVKTFGARVIQEDRAFSGLRDEGPLEKLLDGKPICLIRVFCIPDV